MNRTGFEGVPSEKRSDARWSPYPLAHAVLSDECAPAYAVLAAMRCVYLGDERMLTDLALAAARLAEGERASKSGEARR